ncbi:unnamed protein product [Cyprideis torosa]|uniref:Uncharacterized protein n=1 Tax=Cyprideis torosa TaxID=163714 RepID=A0A7R8W8P1_9CRUS|nr:unnamed protein product [Cyprideis torosa]CAG0883665.1 unnamed protein product [Cyprideis torosa]
MVCSETDSSRLPQFLIPMDDGPFEFKAHVAPHLSDRFSGNARVMVSSGKAYVKAMQVGDAMPFLNAQKQETNGEIGVVGDLVQSVGRWSRTGSTGPALTSTQSSSWSMHSIEPWNTEERDCREDWVKRASRQMIGRMGSCD